MPGADVRAAAARYRKTGAVAARGIIVLDVSPKQIADAELQVHRPTVQSDELVDHHALHGLCSSEAGARWCVMDRCAARWRLWRWDRFRDEPAARCAVAAADEGLASDGVADEVAGHYRPRLHAYRSSGYSSMRRPIARTSHRHICVRRALLLLFR